MDPFEFGGFRYDADKASTWLQESAVDLASPQENGGQSALWKLVAKFLLVVAMANFLVASLLWDLTTKMDFTLIERWNLWQTVNRLFICGINLTENWCTIYSDYIGNSQRSSLSPTGSVKSTSPVTENHNKNGYENYIHNTNFIMTNEDNNHDTNYTNKNDTNKSRRARPAWVSTAARCLVVFLVSLMSSHDPLGSSRSCVCHLHAMLHMCGSLWPHLPPFLLRPVLHRLLPLLCPDVPWPAHQPRQPGLRGK